MLSLKPTRSMFSQSTTLCPSLCHTHMPFPWFLLSPTGLETLGRQKESESVSRLVLPNSATPCTVVCQAPLSMGFSRQEYWRGLPFPYFLLQGIFLTQGSNLDLMQCRQILYCLSRKTVFFSPIILQVTSIVSSIAPGIQECPIDVNSMKV